MRLRWDMVCGVMLAVTWPVWAKEPALEPVVLHTDDFFNGLDQWVVETKKAQVEVIDGQLNIDTPGGTTVWFKHRLEGPVEITYTATMVGDGGPNDTPRNLNCFWMATAPRNREDFFFVKRTGVFSDYDQLKGYYASFGHQKNDKVRFRRYIGVKGDRPLLPEHDLSGEGPYLKPGEPLRLRLVADGSRVQYFVNDRLWFDVDDPEPYTSGYFGIRTMMTHVRIDDFAVRRPAAGTGIGE